MKQFIKNTLVEMHKTVRTDKYGQVHISKFEPSIFGDKAEEVQQYCKENRGILNFSTYGWRYGTYTAFTIEDKEIRSACNRALSNNKYYIKNMTSW